MSKIYDALQKSQREQAVPKKDAISSEPIPEPEVPAVGRMVEQETPHLITTREIEPKEPIKRPAVHHGRLASRVSVGRLLANPTSLLGEQFRKLRSMITTQSLVNGLRAVLVTSCMPEEGKTTVTLNLSSAIAHGLDDSVILIDADLRRLSLTSLLGLKNAPGLLDILEGGATIEESLVDTEIDGLTVIPGGYNPAKPAELVASARMRNLIHELKERYKGSYIIIDSTPIVSTSESHVLGQMVDGIILVILADQTRRDVIKRELQVFDRKKLLGVVLNCAEFETSHYYSKYYKEYYGKPSK